MLTLQDINDHPEGASALHELRKAYVISETASGLLLTKKDGDFRLFLYEIDDVIGAARRNAAHNDQEPRHGSASKRYRSEDVASGATNLVSARQIIAKLEDRIAQLQTTGKALTQERDQWQLRAAQAEEKLHLLEAIEAGGSDKRYGALRRFLARQFHPDHAPGSGIEKIIRNEIFKEIWAEISRIDTGGR